jgi:hypothetical protein
MEANEVHELQEVQEHAGESQSLRLVSFSMSVLAVLLAMTTVLGHRTHTEAILAQSRASDQWNFYQAKKIREYSTQNATDLLSTLTVRDEAQAKKIIDGYQAHEAKWNSDIEEEHTEALKLEAEVRTAERKAARFDLGEALLQIGVIITSITLLTRKQIYWHLGMFFGAAGIVAAVMGLFIH